MSRDVELVIKAKDAATTAIESIKDALKDLTGVQEQVGKSASKTDSLLGSLGAQLSQLNREAKGLSSLGKISGELEKAGTAVGRLEGNIRASAAEFARLARETQAAEQNTQRLKSQVAGYTANLKEQEAATKAAKAAQTAANRELREAERALGSLEKQLSKSAKPSQDLIDQADAQRKLVASLRANQQQSVTGYQAQRLAQDGAAKSLRELNVQIKAAERNQQTLGEASQKSAESVRKQRDDLSKARTEFVQIETIAGQASVALGGVAVNQDKVAAASARMAVELARTKARLDTLNAAPKTTAAAAPALETTTLKEQRRVLLEARRDWVAAEGDVKRLSAAMRQTNEPTLAMAEAFGRAQAQSRLAKQEYLQQRAALAQLATTAQSSFASFSQAATQMQRAGTAASTANRTIGTTASTATAALRPIAPAATAAGNAMQGAAGGASVLRGALAGIYGESRKSLSVFQRLRGEILSLTTSYLGLQAAISNIKGVVTAFQTLEAAQSRLGAVFNQDTSRVKQELEFLERQAQRLGISFDVLADQYGKFAIAANAANFSSKATREIFLSVAEAGRVNKLSTEKLSGVFLALEQMISKGKVSSEELRRQMGDRLPGAFNIFATAIGKSAAELDAMLKSGDVVADQETLLKFAAELNKRFGPQLSTALRTTTTELGRFTDNIFQAQLRVAEGGFIDGLNDGLRELNGWFRSRDGRDFFLSMGSALGKFASALSVVPQYFDEIQIAVQAFVGIKLAGVFTNIFTSIRQMQGSLISAAARFFTWAGTVRAAQGQMTSFGAAIAPFIGAMTRLRTYLQLSSIGFQLIGARAAASSIALGLLRIAAVGVIGSMRLLLAVVGGIPGLILTGLTFALGAWMTGVDDTTEALDEHKRIMGEVLTAYDAVKDKTKDWAKEIQNVTLDQANANLRKMITRFDEMKKKVIDISSVDFFSFNELSRTDSAQASIAIKLRDIDRAFEDGTISAKDFVAKVEELYKTVDDPGLAAWAEALLTSGRNAREAGIEMGAAALGAQKVGNASKEVTDIIADTGVTIKGLSESGKDANETFEDAAKQGAKKFGDALSEIHKLTPKLADELKRLGEIDALKTHYKDAAKLAKSMGQVMQLTRDTALALEEINKQRIDDFAKGDIVDKIIGVERGATSSAKNPNSTATGNGQFIEETWLRLFKEYFPDRAASLTDAMMLELRKNATISREMVAIYVRENAAILQKAGVAITDANLYLAHFLGPTGAVKLLQAPKGTPTSDVLGQDKISANSSILQGKSVEEVIAWAEKKMGISEQELKIQRELTAEDTKRADKAKDYNTDLQSRLAIMADEAANNGVLSRDAFIQKALAEEQKRAREAEVILTEDQIEQLKTLAAAEYERLAAKRENLSSTKEANIALQQAVALMSQQNTLEKLLTEARRNGDTGGAASLQTQLTDVNARLQEAIDKARAMWEAIGGEAADVALTKLDNLKLKVKAGSDEMYGLGLTVSQVRDLANSFADGVIGMFDTFSNAIAKGEDSVKALGVAFLRFAADFLRQISQMIIKTIILKTINTALGLPTIPTGHTGGVVGSSMVGSGNSRRKVQPALFAGAMQYHNGGIAGLRPNEVPAILEKNEEVLTEDDPRHRNNGGRQRDRGGQSGGQSIRNILVLDEESAANWMSSPSGEQVILSTLKRNAATVKRLIG